jgi:hypothetical protein
MDSTLNLAELERWTPVTMSWGPYSTANYLISITSFLLSLNSSLPRRDENTTLTLFSQRQVPLTR